MIKVGDGKVQVSGSGLTLLSDYTSITTAIYKAFSGEGLTKDDFKGLVTVCFELAMLSDEDVAGKSKEYLKELRETIVRELDEVLGV